MKKAFTLAEVLITLGIIGIVAAMTIPALNNKIREKETITKLQTTYSILAQAFKSIEAESGDPDAWNLSGASYNKEDSEIIAKYILPSLKLTQDCGTGANTSCFYGGRYKYLNGTTVGSYGGYGLYKVVLLNGTALSFGQWNANERIDFYVDTNGVNAPNTIGRDLFVISWYKDKGLLPLGATGTGYSCDKSGNGWGCADWVITKRNMDYLK